MYKYLPPPGEKTMREHYHRSPPPKIKTLGRKSATDFAQFWVCLYILAIQVLPVLLNSSSVGFQKKKAIYSLVDKLYRILVRPNVVILKFAPGLPTLLLNAHSAPRPPPPPSGPGLKGLSQPQKKKKGGGGRRRGWIKSWGFYIILN